jgi:hypothetical protein
MQFSSRPIAQLPPPPYVSRAIISHPMPVNLNTIDRDSEGCFSAARVAYSQQADACLPTGTCPCCGNPPADRYVDPAFDHKPILAERFKTQMCRNYERTGSCPYVHRCMFAHGEWELRTPDMNILDGLVTEAAIKEFKRVNYEVRRAASEACGLSQPSGYWYAPIVPSATSVAPVSVNDESQLLRSWSTPPLTPVAAPSERSTTPNVPTSVPPLPAAADATSTTRRYRHDPYAERSSWRPVTPSLSSASSTRSE